MPSKRKLMGGLFSDEEAALISKRAQAKGLTVANYFRSLAGFKPLQSGPPKGNQNAVGNKGRWNKSDT